MLDIVLKYLLFKGGDCFHHRMTYLHLIHIKKVPLIFFAVTFTNIDRFS